MRLYILLTLLLSLPHWLGHSQDLPRHMVIAESYVGTVEKTGKNDGPVIEHIIKKGGGRKGNPYCAFFVTYCIDSAQVKYPTVRTGLASNFIVKRSKKAQDVLTGKYEVKYGDIIVWRKGNTIYGHTGFARWWNKKTGHTIEANTSPGDKGSQSNGDGIYHRIRKIEPLNYFRITHFTPVEYDGINER